MRKLYLEMNIGRSLLSCSTCSSDEMQIIMIQFVNLKRRDFWGELGVEWEIILM
jgi:hypothetical protein